LKNYIIYDCEIIKLIPHKTETNLGQYQYCKGWNDHANMGISVVGFAYADGSTGYWDSSVRSLQDLGRAFASHDLVIGFNSRNFDDRLMDANGIQIRTDYDILEEVRLAAYGSIDYRDCPKGFSYALGALGAANGFPKTGTGELAPKLWQDGERQKVIDYCLNDVKITKAILDLGLAGLLKDPNTGELLRLRPFP
jgi:hypothetical protein